MARKTLQEAGIEQVFDDQEVARRYDSHIQRYAGMVSKRLITLLAERKIATGRLLDVGCGPGHVIVDIARVFQNIHCVGVDLGEAILDIARGKADVAGVGERTDFQQGDAQQLHFEDNSFDIVINSSMLHMVDDPQAMLSEIERVLKPEGLFMICNIKRSWLMSFLSKAFRSSYTYKEAKEIVEQAITRPWQGKAGFLDYTFVSQPVGM